MTEKCNLRLLTEILYRWILSFALIFGENYLVTMIKARGGGGGGTPYYGVTGMCRRDGRVFDTKIP